MQNHRKHKATPSKKWTHLQKYQESVGKFQSLLEKCQNKKILVSSEKKNEKSSHFLIIFCFKKINKGSEYNTKDEDIPNKLEIAIQQVFSEKIPVYFYYYYL